MTQKRPLIEMPLTAREYKTLKKGGHIYKVSNGHIHNIYLDSKETRRMKEIKKLRARIRELTRQQKETPQGPEEGIK